jgi:hypothetical protein
MYLHILASQHRDGRVLAALRPLLVGALRTASERLEDLLRMSTGCMATRAYTWMPVACYDQLPVWLS